MADGHDATLISRNRDANSATNTIFSSISDGTNTATVNGSGELLVSASITANAEKAEDAAHVSGDTGNYVLTVREDTLASSTSATGDYQSFKTDSVGALWVNISNTSVSIDDGGNIITVDGTVTIQDGGGSITVDNAGTFAVQTGAEYAEDSAHTTADTGLFVLGVRNSALATLTDADGDYSAIATTDKGAVYTEILQGGAANSLSNPIFVQTVEDATSSSEVHDYDTAASVAKDATSNHDYTVANTTFLLKQITASSSGDVKVEVQTGPLASLATVWVGFVGSKAGGSIQHKFCPPVEVPSTSTGTVRLIRTNRGSAALDLYSTIEGNDI